MRTSPQIFFHISNMSDSHVHSAGNGYCHVKVEIIRAHRVIQSRVIIHYIPSYWDVDLFIYGYKKQICRQSRVYFRSR